MITPAHILQFLRSKKYTPMTAAELAEHFEVNDAEYKQFCELLQGMEFSGDIVKIKKKQYAYPKKVNLMVGILECKARGYGFVIPVKKEETSDIFISGEDMGSAMHGDLVVVRIPTQPVISRRRRGRNESGKIVHVLKHVNDKVVGMFEKSKQMRFVVPDDSRLFKDIYIADKDSGGAKPGEKVVVRITEWPSRHLNPEGKIIEVLGKDGDPEVDLRSVIYQYKIPQTFPKKVEDETKKVPSCVPPEALTDRLDLRNKLLITIDPEDAKDFDDAVSLERDKNGDWCLGVHIADVSHYVKPNTAIDKEARFRGTSVYLPGKVIPMLPEVLSNNICSLREGEDRLTKTVLITLNEDGFQKRFEIKHSVINVSKRLSYSQATAILNNSIDINITQEAIESLHNMAGLAKKLFQNRIARGAIELDLPEVSLKLDEYGYVKDVEKEERDISHQLIEEFMLLANEAVATYMHEKKMPLISRAHPEPEEDAMFDFASFVNSLECTKVNPFKINELQKLLDEVRGKPEAYTVNLVLLKSMKQAVYSAVDEGHYALALEHYTHFTSPIRRYPDLIVHRILDQYFFHELSSPVVQNSWKSCLPEWAMHCSETERRADDAEREINKLKLLRFFENQMGSVFEGVITGVQEYGFFVQLNTYLLEGLVHMRTLTDDIYQVDKKNMALVGVWSRKMYRIGQKVKIQIYKIDFLKREIDFTIYEKKRVRKK